MQFYHAVPLPHSIQWCPSLFFSELCTISLLLPHSWQMASAHIIHEKLKLSDGNFIPLPPPPTNFPHLCTWSLPFFLFHQLSVTPSIWIPFLPLVLWIWPLLHSSGSLFHSSFSLLYWSFWWPLNTCSGLTDWRSSFNHKSFYCLSNLSLHRLFKRDRCAYFLFHFLILDSLLSTSFYQPIRAVLLVATDGLHIPQKAILHIHPKGRTRNSSLYLFCQEYLGLLIALSLLLALMTSHCLKYLYLPFVVSFAGPSCSI